LPTLFQAIFIIYFNIILLTLGSEVIKICSSMTERLLWLLLLLWGPYTHMEAVGVQVVGVPPQPELTQAFINSERLHTANVSSTLVLREGSQESRNNTDDGSPTANITLCGTVNLNKIVDGLLDGLRADIIERGKDKISIPDMHETFHKKVGFLKVKGEFDGEDGWAKNLSTVHRTADAVASAYGNWISVSCGFGLGHLEVGYDSYQAKFMRIGPRGKIRGIIGKNSILLNATVTLNGHKCALALNELVLNQFGGLSLDVTGLGPINWLFSKISTWVLQHFKSEIKDKIESTLREEIIAKLSHFDCMEYLR
jgi:hypothetical protein